MGRKEDAEDLRMAEEMRDLIATPAWKTFARILQGHIDEKMRAMLMPLFPVINADGTEYIRDGLAHVLVGEAAKGAIIGLRLALTLPQGIVSGAEEIRARVNPSNAEDSK